MDIAFQRRFLWSDAIRFWLDFDSILHQKLGQKWAKIESHHSKGIVSDYNFFCWLVMLIDSTTCKGRAWSNVCAVCTSSFRYVPLHTSAQEELSETKISQDSNSMAFLIDNLPIIWWQIWNRNLASNKDMGTPRGNPDMQFMATLK